MIPTTISTLFEGEVFHWVNSDIVWCKREWKILRWRLTNREYLYLNLYIPRCGIIATTIPIFSRLRNSTELYSRHCVMQADVANSKMAAHKQGILTSQLAYTTWRHNSQDYSHIFKIEEFHWAITYIICIEHTRMEQGEGRVREFAVCLSGQS